jgi:NADH-quinone oxidoreductase subunit C
MNSMAFKRQALLAELQPLAESIDHGAEPEISARLEAGRLQDCCRLLLQHEFYLSFLTAVHLRPACELVYRFAHFESPCCVMLRVSAVSDNSVPSIADIYQGAAWHEREVFDFFGITFTGHPHLKPLILSREERDFKPLLKDASSQKSLPDIFPKASPTPPDGK